MFSVTSLYSGIYKALANDEIILTLLGLDLTADDLTKAKRIRRRMVSQELVSDFPTISLYALPGHTDGENDRVYYAPFVFDVLTADDEELAMQISERIMDIFDGEINLFAGVENFEAKMLSQHESKTNLPNTYCFTTVLQFVVSIDA